MEDAMSGQWAVIVGFFLPLLLSVILQAKWSTALKSVVSFAVVMAATAITAWVEGKVDSANLLSTFFYVLTATIASFKALWQPTGVAQALEKATSFSPEYIDRGDE